MRGRGRARRDLLALVVLNLLLVAATAVYVVHRQSGSGTPDRGPVPATAGPTPRVAPDRVLAALDPDTRRTLRRLLQATDRPWDQGGTARLARALQHDRTDATTRRRITRELARRTTRTERATRRLRQVAEALADKPDDLGRAIDATATVAGVLAQGDASVRSSVRELPAVLRGAQTALGHTADLAAALQPATAALRPLVGKLEPTLDALDPFLRQTTPVLTRQLLPAVRQTPKALRRLRSAARTVADRAPDATATLGQLNRATNLLAYDPPGSEQGYLFWTQWLVQLAPWVFGTHDGRPVVRSQTLVTCTTLTRLTAAGRVSPTAAPLTDVFADLARSGLCPKRAGGTTR